MATFDFKSYLSNIDPVNEYKVTVLSGGRVNITVRATKTRPCTVSVERFPGRESIVLKYAPPYIAMDGQGATFSQFRQVSCISIFFLFLNTNFLTRPSKHEPLGFSPFLTVNSFIYAISGISRSHNFSITTLTGISS